MEPMSNTFNFTLNKLNTLKPSKKNYDIYRDKGCRGLYCLVYKSGAKSFEFKRFINSKIKRIVLGRIAEITLIEAREKSNKFNIQISRGLGAVELKTPSVKMTLAMLEEEFIEQYSKIHKKTFKRDQSCFHNHLASLNHKLLSTITTNDIQTLFVRISKINGKISANRMISLIITIFNYAIQLGYMAINPALGIKKFKELSRSRFLDKDELSCFFKSLHQETNAAFKDYIYLSLLTGARRQNMLSMRWDDINLDEKTWCIPTTKNGEPLLLPLSEAAVTILKNREVHKAASGFVFPSTKKPNDHIKSVHFKFKGILKRAGIKDFRIHDLRRTMASLQAANGSSLAIIGKSLGHKSMSATAIYARLNIDSTRASIDKASNSMMEIASV